MAKQQQELEWLNVRLVSSEDGYALIFTDSITINDSLKFKIIAHTPEYSFGHFLGMCLAEVNDIPFLDESKAGTRVWKLDEKTVN